MTDPVPLTAEELDYAEQQPTNLTFKNNRWLATLDRDRSTPSVDGLRWLADNWTPLHTSFCAMQEDDAECICGVGDEYERMLATALAATPTPAPEPDGKA